MRSPSTGGANATRILVVLALALTGMLALAGTASAAATLDARPLTWDLIGLDSNKPTTQGPQTFPVGTEICNNGDATTGAITADFHFTGSNSYISLQGETNGTTDAVDKTLPALAAGECADVYWYVTIARDARAQ